MGEARGMRGGDQQVLLLGKLFSQNSSRRINRPNYPLDPIRLLLPVSQRYILPIRPLDQSNPKDLSKVDQTLRNRPVVLSFITMSFASTMHAAPSSLADR